MRTLAVVVLAAGAGLQDLTPQRVYPIRPVEHGDVELLDGFWRDRLDVNRSASIPHILRQNALTGRVANFEKAAKLKPGKYEGRRFNDTDIYKAIEAASYSLKRTPDASLSAALDRLIDLIAKSQEPDGYLMPARTIDPPNPAPGMGPERWVHLNGSHELYNFGHLYEAAIAHVEATGKRTLLDVALKNANLVASTFGPGTLRAIPGHEEIELALIRLFRLTGVPRYYEAARFFLDQRGGQHETKPYPDGPFAMYNDRPYKQDHLPVVQQDRAVGHAVRAVYLYSAMADVAGLQRDKAYLAASERIWRDMISKRMYVTGGIGSRGTVEAFGDDYELPNRTAYTETCASAGNVFWNARMFLTTGNSAYIDVLERTLYNGLLSGVSISGDRFFYQNPLESNGRAERSEYFDVACCPANLARTIAQMPGYIYAHEGETLFVNLYTGSRARVPLGRGPVAIEQTTNYPWDGDVRIRVSPETPRMFTVAFRHPAWTAERPLESDLYRYTDGKRLPPPVIEVNGETFIDVRGPQWIHHNHARVEGRRRDSRPLPHARPPRRRAPGSGGQRRQDGLRARAARLRDRSGRQRRRGPRSDCARRRAALLGVSPQSAWRRAGRDRSSDARRAPRDLHGRAVLRLGESRPWRDGCLDPGAVAPGPAIYHLQSSHHMKFLRPIPARVTRVVSILILAAWAGVAGLLVHRSYISASAANLATDLARYGAEAQWRGIYYRGEKIGFAVGQIVPTAGGFEMHEDGRMQISLLGADTVAVLKTTARVDQSFALQSFEFSLDPGTGPTRISGTVDGLQLALTVTTPTGTRTDTRTLTEPPALALNLGRRLAAAGLRSGDRHQVQIFDPATLSNAPMTITVRDRELIRAGGLPVPAFRLEMEFAGLSATSWMTDTGEVVREESALGMLVVKEDPEVAQRMAVSQRTRSDIIETAAIVPDVKYRIDDPRSVRRIVLRLTGAAVPPYDLQGAGQTASISPDGVQMIEIRDARELDPGAPDPDAPGYLLPEPLIESDAPEIVAEAKIAIRDARDPRDQAERLVRHVNALLEKKPTVSIPSAREVLRTKIGDCNEHTALYVAMARASGIPARIAVGLVYVNGAFFYHAWPEVYLTRGPGAEWLPVDPTLNQFPADATHLRIARGGLNKQTVVLPLIGRLKIQVVDMSLAEGAIPILAGRPAATVTPVPAGAPRAVPAHAGCGCWRDR
ncbi:MAG: beta-L-arabinofuranosidase domain-containing protein [Vicinamibacterales bacterium]